MADEMMSDHEVREQLEELMGFLPALKAECDAARDEIRSLRESGAAEPGGLVAARLRYQEACSDRAFALIRILECHMLPVVEDYHAKLGRPATIKPEEPNR